MRGLIAYLCFIVVLSLLSMLIYAPFIQRRLGL